MCRPGRHLSARAHWDGARCNKHTPTPIWKPDGLSFNLPYSSLYLQRELIVPLSIGSFLFFGAFSICGAAETLLPAPSCLSGFGGGWFTWELHREHSVLDKEAKNRENRYEEEEGIMNCDWGGAGMQQIQVQSLSRHQPFTTQVLVLV